jgi:amidase
MRPAKRRRRRAAGSDRRFTMVTLTPEDYVELDASAAAALVNRGELAPAALTEAAIERIEALNPHLNAVVEKNYTHARDAASRMDISRTLAGVPFLAKDMNIEVRGLHLTASCRFLDGLPAATQDSPLAQRWRAAGLSILGRTNTPEFAGEFVTEPTWRGATLNPWNVRHSPGGSSGGAAAAVASGMVPLAHGTDSGGSIRVPAAVCGLVGLKPSRGWVPVGPHHDELAGGFDCEHVLTRTVRDSALLLDLTAGNEPSSRAALQLPLGGFVRTLHERLAPLRVGIALRAPGGRLPDEQIVLAVELAGTLLSRAGHEVREFRYPASVAGMGAAAGVIWMTAIAEEVSYYREKIGRPPRREELEALSWACVEQSGKASAVDYVAARRALSAVSRDMALALQDVDVLLMPSTAQTAVPTGSIDGRSEQFSMERWNESSYRFAPYTELFNVTGQPAISLPLAVSREGLPIGVQLCAPLGEDARLLKLAAWFEQELPWQARLKALRARWLKESR